MTGAELGTRYTESSHLPCASNRGFCLFVEYLSVSPPAPECRCPGDRAQGPVSPGGKNSVRPRDWKNKRKKKARRGVAKMGGKREGGRGQGKATIS